MNPIRIDESTLNALLDASAVLVAARDTVTPHVAAIHAVSEARPRAGADEEDAPAPWSWLQDATCGVPRCQPGESIT